MSRKLTLALATLLALISTSCAAQTADRPSLKDLVASAKAAAPTEADEVATQTEPSPIDESTVSSEAPASATASPTSTPDPSPSPSESRSSPTAPSDDEPLEEHSDFPMTASLARDCVVPGGEMTITVDAGENTGVAYHAVYAGGEGGADPPYGEGHGGNGGDLTDENGRYQDTWVVSPTAPVGSARVDVVAGRDGGFSTTVLRFEVADPTKGGCS